MKVLYDDLPSSNDYYSPVFCPNCTTILRITTYYSDKIIYRCQNCGFVKEIAKKK